MSEVDVLGAKLDALRAAVDQGFRDLRAELVHLHGKHEGLEGRIQRLEQEQARVDERLKAMRQQWAMITGGVSVVLGLAAQYVLPWLRP